MKYPCWSRKNSFGIKQEISLISTSPTEDVSGLCTRRALSQLWDQEQTDSQNQLTDIPTERGCSVRHGARATSGNVFSFQVLPYHFYLLELLECLEHLARSQRNEAAIHHSLNDGRSDGPRTGGMTGHTQFQLLYTVQLTGVGISKLLEDWMFLL